MTLTRFVLSAACAAAVGLPAAAAELEVGQKAPEFAVPDHTGKIQKLSDYKGKRVVLAFYPAAGTAG